jgi:hypothetical protein
MLADRSGCRLVELTVLASFEALTAGDPDLFVKSSRALAGIEDRIGLGPRYGYQVLTDMTRPWVMAMPLAVGQGNFGDRAFPEPSEARYTESRQSHVGQLVLDAEAHRIAPVPVGLINGTAYRGGTQPALEPSGAMAALRKLVTDPDTPDADLLGTVVPYSPASCDLTGDLGALVEGRPTEIRQRGRIIVTGVPVPEPSPPEPPRSGVRKLHSYAGIGSKPHEPPHLVIESLPAESLTSDVAEEIGNRSRPRRPRGDSPGDLARQAWEPVILPIAEIHDDTASQPSDEGAAYPVCIGLILQPGSDPAAVRDELLTIHGITTLEVVWAFPTPLAQLLRSWTDRHRSEDIAASLDRLEEAISLDRSSELDRR